MKRVFFSVKSMAWCIHIHYLQALVLTFAVLFFAGCPENTPGSDIPVSGSILQPGSFYYDEDNSIIFQAQIHSASGIIPSGIAVHWQSSIEGELGDGVWISRKLRTGEHIISLVYEDCELARKTIVIQPVVYEHGQSRLLGLGGVTNQILLPAGAYSPFFYSLDGKRPAITVLDSVEDKADLPSSSLNRISCIDEDILECKEFSLMSVSLPQAAPIKAKDIHTNDTTQGRNAYSIQTPIPELGQTREFLVADTTGVRSEGIVITCRLAFSSDRLSVWIDENGQVSESVLTRFLDGLKFRAWPRVVSIWGSDWADTDNNNALAVLITPLINQQQMAIGFFNPADLYPRNTDAKSTAFNPVSNEMDIIYLAAPTDDPSVFAYSINSILATFCHETTHLIGFSRSFYLPAASGQQVSREELFLDEGLAHLTENLCGYGESGGNLAFFARYLENPEQYSLCKSDADGASDSIGKRGMTAAFLSWLFWEKGGAVWDAVDPGKITDTGGISFLRHLLATSQRGLANISCSAGIDAHTLLVRWFSEIDLQDMKVLNLPEVYFDPHGGEAITMSPFYGNLLVGSKVYTLNGPHRKDIFRQNICLPYSVIWGKPFGLSNKQLISVDSSIVDNGSYACFNMIE